MKALEAIGAAAAFGLIGGMAFGAFNAMDRDYSETGHEPSGLAVMGAGFGMIGLPAMAVGVALFAPGIGAKLGAFAGAAAAATGGALLTDWASKHSPKRDY